MNISHLALGMFVYSRISGLITCHPPETFFAENICYLVCFFIWKLHLFGIFVLKNHQQKSKVISDWGFWTTCSLIFITPNLFKMIEREKYIVQVKAVEFEDWCCCNKYFGEITLKPLNYWEEQLLKYFTLNITTRMLAFIDNDH